MKLKFWQKTLLAIANFLYPSKFYGKENLPEGGAIIVSNHFSVFEVFQYLNISKERPYFLAKKEVCEGKFFNKLFTSFGAIPIDRSKPDMKAMISAMRVLKDEQRLVIFPEGTRNKTGTNELQELKSGASIFAVKTKKPIVPAMLLSKPKIFRKTKIIVGKPFELSEFYDKKFTEDDVKIMDGIVREKMICEQERLKEMVSNKNARCKK